jgi:hypothetical protein
MTNPHRLINYGFKNNAHILVLFWNSPCHVTWRFFHIHLTFPKPQPTYLPTDPPTYRISYLPACSAIFRHCPSGVSLPTLPTFSLFLSKTTPYLPTYPHVALYLGTGEIKIPLSPKTTTYLPTYQPTYLSNFLPTYVLLFLPPRLLYLHSHFLLSHYPPYLPSQYFITTVFNMDRQWLLDLNGNCP